MDALGNQIAQNLSERDIAGQVQSLIAQKVLDHLQDLAGNYPNVPIGPVGGSDLDQIKEEILSGLSNRLTPVLWLQSRLKPKRRPWL